MSAPVIPPGTTDLLAAIGLDLARAEADTPWRAAALARIQRVHETLKAARAPRPRLVVLAGIAPLLAGGRWMPELVRRAGGIDVLATPGTHAVAMTPDAVRAADPDLILVAVGGYDLPQAVAAAHHLREDPEWSWARDRRWAAIDAEALLSRPGPRLIDGIEAIAHAVAPTLLPSPPTDHLVLLT